MRLKPRSKTQKKVLFADEEPTEKNNDLQLEETKFERDAREFDANQAVVEQEAQEEFTRQFSKQKRKRIHKAEQSENQDEGEEDDTTHEDDTHETTAEPISHQINENLALVPPEELRTRIEEYLDVLRDFSAKAPNGASRKDYINNLAATFTEYFGYLRELIDMFLNMFSPSECYEYLSASERQRQVTIRVNTLRVPGGRRELSANLTQRRGVLLESIPWTKYALKITHSKVPLGATPEYLHGDYFIQSMSSLVPVLALNPQPDDCVLDFCSAPGGKTTFISQLMKNRGVVVANDIHADRQKSTLANLHRLGVLNAIITQYDGTKLSPNTRILGKNFKFDKILLDAPCSGLGVVSKDQSVKQSRNLGDIKEMAHTQKKLLLQAIDMAKARSGVIVFSTCSTSPHENELVVDYALQKRFVKLVPLFDADEGKKEIAADDDDDNATKRHKSDVGSLALTRYKDHKWQTIISQNCRRFYPHVHDMDGFFVAKFLKMKDGVKEKRSADGNDREHEHDDDEEYDEDEEDEEYRPRKRGRSDYDDNE